MTDLYQFDYLSGARSPKAIGPYLEKSKAEEKRRRATSMGIPCTQVYPVEGDPETVKFLKAKKQGFVEGALAEFEFYLKRELAVLDSVVGYEITYNYIRELRKRVRRFVRKNAPPKGSPTTKKMRPIYLEGVSVILQEKAQRYSPMDGSVPEYIGDLLRKLAEKPL